MRLQDGRKAGAWRALMLAVPLLVCATAIAGSELPLAITPTLGQHAESAPVVLPELPGEPAGRGEQVSLQLSPSLANAGLTPGHPASARAPAPMAPAAAPTPSGRGLWTFSYWFALLLLVGIAARDSLRVMLQILWQPDPRRAPLPHAAWPSISLAFCARDTETLEQTLGRIRELDYPPQQLQIIALIDPHDEPLAAALQRTRTGLASEALSWPLDRRSDATRQCFAAALQSGRSDIVMTLPAGEPLASQSLKRAAEAFLDPTLGALLGYLPPGAPGDQGIAARLGRLQRRASTKLGLAPAQSLPPGTGLVALRRACVQSAGIDPELPHGTLPILLDIEAAAWRINLQTDQIAAGAPMQDWSSRASWLRRRARARIEHNPATSLFGLLRHGRFAGEPGPILTLLWIGVLLAALLRFFMGDVFSAAIGLAACMACAFGVEARPASLLALGILLRTQGRNPAVTLAAYAPVVFVHDLQVTLRQTVRSIAKRLRPHRSAADPLGAPSVMH